MDSEKLNPSPQKSSTQTTLHDDLQQNSDTENSNSGLIFDDHDSLSDCESGISGTQNEQEILNHPDNGLIRMIEGDKIYEIIKRRVVSTLSVDGFNSQVETVYKCDYSGIMRRARNLSFCLYAKAMEKKCGGNANVKYAWYSGSKNEIDDIISHGFGLPSGEGVYGRGVYLSPADQSMQLPAADHNGLRHALLCRVILGRTELISPGSGQFNPSSEEFDSGADDLMSPKKYVIWSSSMNTRILPEFMVSFKVSSFCKGLCRRITQPLRVPKSDWMPFATLIGELSKFLPSDDIKSIAKHHSDHAKQKITRHEMIQRVRNIAGDKLLIAIIKSYREKIRRPGAAPKAV